MTKKVKVIAIESNEILLEVDIADMEKAYEYAAKMDEMGIEVKVDAPTITDTLANTLGLNMEDQDRLKQSALDEINDHEGAESCCTKPFDPATDKLQ